MSRTDILLECTDVVITVVYSLSSILLLYCWYVLFFFQYWVFELKASCLLHRCSTSWVNSPDHYMLFLYIHGLNSNRTSKIPDWFCDKACGTSNYKSVINYHLVSISNSPFFLKRCTYWSNLNTTNSWHRIYWNLIW
jgi:hypothetical protein